MSDQPDHEPIRVPGPLKARDLLAALLAPGFRGTAVAFVLGAIAGVALALI